MFVNQVAKSERTPRVSVLLNGLPGSGKTVLAATIAWRSEYPFVKIISPDRMVGFSEAQKIAAITKTFNDSYKSPLSVIVVDNLERLLGLSTVIHLEGILTRRLQIGHIWVIDSRMPFFKHYWYSLHGNLPR